MAKCDYEGFGKEHTMCKYTKHLDCVLASTLSSTQKNLILRLHNEFRQSIANGSDPNFPKAANMVEMAWDDELEMIAQKWTDQCKQGPDAERRSYKYPISIGQNRFLDTEDDDKVKKDVSGLAVRTWFSKKQGFSTNDVAEFKSSEKTNHFSQMIWATSESIGCGFTRYKEVFFSNAITCNYGPAGNIPGNTAAGKEKEPNGATRLLRFNFMIYLCVFPILFLIF
uniref:Cysteine-rich venom protein n=1 Tax=Strigamia maritima TaxID=126957 RepID=T1IKB6_STRMM